MSFVQFVLDGNLKKDIATAGTSPSGLAFNGKYFYEVDYANSNVRLIDQNRNIIKTWNIGLTNPFAITFTGKHLIITEFSSGIIRTYDQNLKLLRSFNHTLINVNAVAFEGRCLYIMSNIDYRYYAYSMDGVNLGLAGRIIANNSSLFYDGKNFIRSADIGGFGRIHIFSRKFISLLEINISLEEWTGVCKNGKDWFVVKI